MIIQKKVRWLSLTPPLVFLLSDAGNDCGDARTEGFRGEPGATLLRAAETSRFGNKGIQNRGAGRPQNRFQSISQNHYAVKRPKSGKHTTLSAVRLRGGQQDIPGPERLIESIHIYFIGT